MRNATPSTPRTPAADHCPIPWCTTTTVEHQRDIDNYELLLHTSETVDVSDSQPANWWSTIQVRFTSATEADGREIEAPHVYVSGDEISMRQAEELAAALTQLVAAYRAHAAS